MLITNARRMTRRDKAPGISSRMAMTRWVATCLIHVRQDRPCVTFRASALIVCWEAREEVTAKQLGKGGVAEERESLVQAGSNRQSSAGDEQSHPR